MAIERALFAILLAVIVAVFAGWFDEILPAPGPRVGPGGVLSLPRLQATSERVDLPLEGGGRAEVFLPLGARRPRPVLVLLGEASGAAKFGCADLHRISKRSLFTLCMPVTGGGELRGALAALKRRFGDYVAKGSVVLVGAGRGAVEAIALGREEPSFFARLLLIDGGRELWSATVASVFRRGGGERVVFACSEDACVSESERARAVARTLGLDVAVADLTTGTEQRRSAVLQQRFDWLVSGDARFAHR